MKQVSNSVGGFHDMKQVVRADASEVVRVNAP
jgi:hypothetical protein